MRALSNRISSTHLVLASAIVATCALSPTLVYTQADTNDEQRVLLVFPSFAVEDGSKSWKAKINGWIYEQVGDGERSRFRTEFEFFLGQWFGVPSSTLEAAAPADASHFSRRSRLFLVDNKWREDVVITVQGATGDTDTHSNGHFDKDLTFPRGTARAGDWVDVRVVDRKSGRAVDGKVQLIGSSGVSIVSDIDDTIKVSNVNDKPELARNTFVRDFTSVAGMAALYRQWEGGGATFHYVSGSPYQLYPDLAEMVTRDQFPAGSFHLRHFRLFDRSVLQFFGNPKTFKLKTIGPLLDQFKKRNFILVGDSGEMDPEVYEELARDHDNVKAILIREVLGPARRAAIDKLFATLPARVVRVVFNSPSELATFKLP
jgi:phosphatidate phosphatase APP1